MNEKRFVDHDTAVENYVENLESKNLKEKTKRKIKQAPCGLHSFCDGEDYEPSSLSLKTINKNLNLRMYIINAVPQESALYSIYALVFALTRSISDTSTTRA